MPLDEGEEAVSVAKVGQTVIYQVKAPWPVPGGAKPKTGTLAITQEQLGRYAIRGMGTSVAQFYSIVAPGIILARYIFRGLRRPLSDNGDPHADRQKLVYSWKPARDYEWHGNGFTGGPVEMGPPDGRVFVVLVSPNSCADFPEVDGWLERWNWVRADHLRADAPTDAENRYEDQLWRRE